MTWTPGGSVITSCYLDAGRVGSGAVTRASASRAHSMLAWMVWVRMFSSVLSGLKCLAPICERCIVLVSVAGLAVPFGTAAAELLVRFVSRAAAGRGVRLRGCRAGSVR
jgi:hypothetical protein